MEQLCFFSEACRVVCLLVIESNKHVHVMIGFQVFSVWSCAYHVSEQQELMIFDCECSSTVHKILDVKSLSFFFLVFQMLGKTK